MAPSQLLRDKLMHSDGTTAIETLSVIVPSAFYILASTLLISLLRAYFNLKPAFIFCVEFATLVIPIILNVTILATYTREMFVSALAIGASLVFVTRSLKMGLKPTLLVFEYRDCMTNFRSTISIITVIAILAVDFFIFPRRFAKTENFGFSLMDVGVGLFMVANGIVDDGKVPFLKVMKQSLPLFLIGFIRFFTTRQLDYHVPVSEYGVHWNFFITLAVTKIFANLIFNIFKIRFIWINASLLLASHEILLETGLKNFVLSKKKRTDFVSANKEGLVSCLGYVSLYLLAAYFGYFVNLRRNINNPVKLLGKFTFLTVLTLALTIVCEAYLGISRKLANAAYCFWILFIAVFMWSIFYISGQIMKFAFRNKSNFVTFSPFIFQAINYNPLLFFLLCNLTTGLVNLMIDTLKMGAQAGIAIVTLYMFFNCVLVFILYHKQIRFRL